MVGRPELLIRSLTAAQGAARRMIGMINEMLVVGKIESNQLTLNLQPTPVVSLLTDCVNSFVTQAEEDNKQLTLDCPSNLAVQLDPDLIGRVMDNLIGNALKYTDQGGLIQVKAWPNNGRMQVRVRDNGEGIPDVYKPHVFDKYVQALDQDGRAQTSGNRPGIIILSFGD